MKPYVLGREKKFEENTTFTARVWINNDHYHAVNNVKVSWKIFNKETQEIVKKNRFEMDLLPDSAEVPDHIVWPISSGNAGRYRIEMSVYDKSNVLLSGNYCDITVIV